MQPFPLFLDLHERTAVVAGGGAPARERVAALRECGARVVIVAPALDAGLAVEAAHGHIEHRPRPFEPADLDDAWLAFAATGDAALDQSVTRAAAERRVPCEASANPATATCRMPAILDRGSARLAVTAGRASGSDSGRVDLVGAGPGDPGLLTVDALAALQQADVILHDRLVPAAVLALGRTGAERRYVGKARARHSYEQDALNALMVEIARGGRRVVRLKGGDPFLFGRGGEEAAALAAEGMPVRVIPGITAAGGCAAYAGIPLTHRDHAHSCQFITAHRRNGAVELDWQALARPQQTLAIYMGLSALADVCAGLSHAGLASTTPAAVVERGTLPEQRVLTGTLVDLPARARPEGLQSPALLIVGEVVRLRTALRADRAEYAPIATTPRHG